MEKISKLKDKIQQLDFEKYEMIKPIINYYNGLIDLAMAECKHKWDDNTPAWLENHEKMKCQVCNIITRNPNYFLTKEIFDTN